MNRDADFSLCRQYRYRLWHTWDPFTAVVVYILLNPSKADGGSITDPTMRRCEERARRLGYGGFVIVNLFALIATNPKDMKAHLKPIGRDNDAAILTAAAESDLIIAGWGNHGVHQGRADVVERMLRDGGHAIHCLGVTRDGAPQHPLYVSYEIQPQPLMGTQSERSRR